MSIEDLQFRAEYGHALAQAHLGVAYFYGEQGLKRNYRLARQWWLKAAEQGENSAQYNLGVMYANGNGVEKNDREAIYWFRMAAAGGYVSAYFSLAKILSETRTTERDTVEAEQWLRKSADFGDPSAHRALAIQYFLGPGGRGQDLSEALFWGLLAVQGNGDPSEREQMEKLTGDVRGYLTPEDQSAVEERIKAWAPIKP